MYKPHIILIAQVICLLLSGSVRVLWLARFPSDPLGPVDAEGYHLLAVNVLAGRGFTIGWEPPFCPTAVRTPLYPLFLIGVYSLFGPNPDCVVLLHVLLEILTTALVLRLATTLGGRRIGLVAGLCYALNGTTQRYTGVLFAETWLLPLMTAALWRTVICLRSPSSRRAAVSAVLWALSLLTKPNVQFLVVFVGGWISGVALYRSRISCSRLRRFWISRVRQPGIALRRLLTPRSQLSASGDACGGPLNLPVIWRAMVFWVVLLALLSPWLVRNYVVLGTWTLSSAFDENLARVSAVATLAEVEGILADPWTETWEYLYGRLVSTAAARFAADEAEALSECDFLQRRRQNVSLVARDLLMQHWETFVATHIWGVTLSLLDPGHCLWYSVLTGHEWQTTGVVENVWVRMAWSLETGAVGDTVHVLWLERVTRIPPLAALVWWGLLLARVLIIALCLRAVWCLRREYAVSLVLLGTVIYILFLPGPIAHDRFYLPAIPTVVTLLAVGLSGHMSHSGEN